MNLIRATGQIAAALICVGRLNAQSAAGPQVIESRPLTGRVADAIRVERQARWIVGGSSSYKGKPIEEVSGAARFSNGTVAVAEALHGRIVYFDSTGKLIRSVGTLGQGGEPGVFNSIMSLTRLGSDRVVAYDISADRLTTLDDKGGVRGWDHIQSVPYVKTPIGKSRLMMEVIGAVDRKQFVARQTFRRYPMGSAKYVDSASIVVIDKDRKWSVASRVLDREWFQFTGVKYGTWDVVPFGRTGALAASGDSWYYSDGSAFEIRRTSLAGAAPQVWRVARPRMKVTPQDIERFKRTRLPHYLPILQPGFAKAFEWMAYPKEFPTYTALIVDAPGNVWARQWAFDGELAKWDVFSATGKLIDEVEVPPDLEVLEIGRDYLLARYNGPEEGQEVRVYRVWR
ncbi:MAG: hypothetical protein ABIS00_14555 [Gemmatimonadales bacterium]